MTTLRSTIGVLASATAGRVVAVVVTRVAVARRPAKPLHPHGRTGTATLVRYGDPGGPGSAFIDAAGSDVAVTRLSRSVGLPVPWPDINGLAIRVARADDTCSDILLSTTGRSRLTRYLLAPSRTERGGFFTTLVPYSSPSGPVQLAAVLVAPQQFELHGARPSTPWRAFARLDLDADPGPVDASFDAVRNTPDGLTNYGWYSRIRAPAYAAARRVRAEPPSAIRR